MERFTSNTSSQEKNEKIEKPFEFEKSPIEGVEIMSGDLLFKKIMKPGEEFFGDSRFDKRNYTGNEEDENSGAFMFSSLETMQGKERIYFLSKEDDGTVAAIAKTGLAKGYYPEDETARMVSFVSTDKKYESRGHGRKLLEAIMEHASRNNLVIIGTSYEKDGKVRLKPIVKDIARDFGTEYYDFQDLMNRLNED